MFYGDVIDSMRECAIARREIYLRSPLKKRPQRKRLRDF
jgi:hypothetical protein